MPDMQYDNRQIQETVGDASGRPKDEQGDGQKTADEHPGDGSEVLRADRRRSSPKKSIARRTESTVDFFRRTEAEGYRRREIKGSVYAWKEVEPQNLSPTASETLAELQALGIDAFACGKKAICYLSFRTANCYIWMQIKIEPLVG